MKIQYTICINLCNIASAFFFVAFMSNDILATPLKKGQIAPEFSLKTSEGKTYSLSQLKGQVLVIFCEDQNTYNQNKKFKETHPKNDARILGLGVANISNVPRRARTAVKYLLNKIAGQFGMPLLLDWKGDFTRAYGFIAGKSTLIVIDKKSRVIFYFNGELPEREISRVHKMIYDAAGK